MHIKYFLLFLILSLSFCARKKTVDTKREIKTEALDSVTSFARVPLWNELSPDQYRNVVTSNTRMPKNFRMFALDSLTMQESLSKSVKLNQWKLKNHNLVIEFPRPDSGFSRFSIYETSTMDSALAAHYPNLKTYGGQEIDNPSESVRFDFNENGFNAFITGPGGEWFIQPLKQGITHQYLLSFYKKDWPASSKIPFELPDSLRK